MVGVLFTAEAASDLTLRILHVNHPDIPTASAWDFLLSAIIATGAFRLSLAYLGERKRNKE